MLPSVLLVGPLAVCAGALAQKPPKPSPKSAQAAAPAGTAPQAPATETPPQKLKGASTTVVVHGKAHAG